MKDNTDTARRDCALVVDLDGSALRTDMLFESFWAALGKHPWRCLKTVAGKIANRAALKHDLAKLAQLDVDELPLRECVIERLEEARALGREVVIASGSDRKLVVGVAKRLGLENGVIASDGVRNMTSGTKAGVLVKKFGEGGFDYIGDSRADLAVWSVANRAIVVAPTRALSRAVAQLNKPVEVIGTHNRPADLIRAMRPHQWIKNILLFLPMVAAHAVGWHSLLMVMWGIAAFSAAASAIYIINDLMDLSADRQHKTKCRRPFASGAATIKSGMLTTVGLAGLALGGAGLHSWQFAAIIAVYMVLSLSYSLGLKRLRWVDVSTLAALYTLRVVAGSVVAGVEMSGWLGAFIFPVFLALGCVKRLVELGKTEDSARLPGRGYAREDRGDLLNIAVTAAVGALVVYGLYTYSDMATGLYENVWMLRLAGVAVALWLARMIWRGWQGRMNDDPIVFALSDPVGIGLMAIGAGLILRAAEVI